MLAVVELLTQAQEQLITAVDMAAVLDQYILLKLE
jgi:hypothetical protein